MQVDCGMQNDKEGKSNRNVQEMTDRQETVKNWQGEWKKKQCLLVMHADIKKQTKNIHEHNTNSL
jgi:hypothetical protein